VMGFVELKYQNSTKNIYQKQVFDSTAMGKLF
jgi:hypothetical protein